MKQEIIDIIKNNQYTDFMKLNIYKETKTIIRNILFFARDNTYKKDLANTIEKEYSFIENYRDNIINTINSIVYEDLKFNSFLNVFSQYTLPSKTESSILKNPFEEQDKYLAIKIENDNMIPKYEKGNIVIVQKSDIFTNGQDVCFKNKLIYDIGRLYIDNDIIAIKYFNTKYDIKFFTLDEFKKFYIGFVVSTRLYN